MNVTVIMSTYNGDQYLNAQIDSILNQTYSRLSIIIRDDGSSDHTREIINNYSQKYTNIHILQDDFGHVGIQCSYSLLLKHVLTQNYSYILFADQDDVWMPNKVEKLLNKIQSVDTENKPSLVFSDARVVDKNLNTLHSSVTQLQKFKTNSYSLKSLLLYCPALGCTMIFNRKLLERIADIPKIAMNPDRWALMVAVCFGKIHYLPETTILYRQHQNNLNGALRGIKRKARKLNISQFLRTRYQTAVNDTKDLENYMLDLSLKDKKTTQQFIQLFTGNYLIRCVNYLRFCLTPPHWKRKVGLFLSLFLNYD